MFYRFSLSPECQFCANLELEKERKLHKKPFRDRTQYMIFYMLDFVSVFEHVLSRVNKIVFTLQTSLFFLE